MIRSFLAYSVVACAALLSACGGGGGGSAASFPVATTPPPQTQPDPQVPAGTTLSGTAAVGAPVAGGTVTVRCSNNVSATGLTKETGLWTVTLGEPDFPCLVAVAGGSLPAGQSLRSLAQSSANVNVTPLTDMVLAVAARANSATLDNAGEAALKALASKLAQAQIDLFAIFSTSGYAVPDFDVFTASFQPAPGDVYDDLMEHLAQSLADSGTSYDTVIETVVASSDGTVPAIPNSIVMKAADLAALPQANQGSLSVASGVLSMKLAAGTNAIGAFVGGGTGNKVVLQLPGLAGTKLKDLQEMSLELKADSAGVVLYPAAYVNLTVDLACNPAPLAPSATLAEVRARRRIVIFEPGYHFIQASSPPQISATEFSTIAFTKATPGWRLSAGDPVGNGVAVGNNYNGSETLEGFDYANYPDACIVDGITGDAGMFREVADPACNTGAALDANSTAATCAKPYSGAIVVLGDSGTFTASEWMLKQVQIRGLNMRTFRFQ
ncbi:MAG: hypothetical protein JWQ73_3893 [Variovorax sp.]|nr:hypothetical protein [Variovorax sp.]